MFRYIYRKFIYKIDKILNKGFLHQVVFLILFITIALIIISTFVSLSFNFSFPNAFWQSLMQFIDTGNISSVEGDKKLVITFLFVTFFGVFGWGLLIAMINNSLQDRIKNLSKGNIFIMEKNHSIILGYGEEVFSIIEELKNGKVKNIVLLSEYDSNYIKKRIVFSKINKKVNIIVREGNPSIIENLKLLNIKKAHSIAIISNDDTQSLKILLSLKNFILNDYKDDDDKMNVSILVANKENIEIIKSIQNEVENQFKIHIIYKYEILYKIIGQSMIYTGLSSVYEELFSYKCIDIKLEDKHNYENYTFNEVALKYMENKMILFGIINEEYPLYIPDKNYKIQKTDTLTLFHSNDDNTIEHRKIKDEDINYNHKVLLILDNNKEKEVINEITYYINREDIIKTYYKDIEEEDSKYNFLFKKIKNNDITKIVLISDHIETDINTINILLIIRHIINKEKLNISILSLITSIENRNLIFSEDIKDFIVSGRLIGTLIAHSLINPKILYLFENLLTKNGNDIIMIKAKDYFDFNDKKTFEDIYNFFINKKSIPIGLKIQSNIILNPDKDIEVNDKYEIIIIVRDEDLLLS